MSEKVLDFKLSEAKADLVDGVREQKAIVNTEPKESVVNTITVDEVKEEVKKGVDSIPETDLSGYYTKTQVDTLFPKKTDVSSMTLLGTATLTTDASGNIKATFNSVDASLITQKTIIIFTYSNCFTLGMLSQTGEGRVCGNLVKDNNGDSVVGKVKFQLFNEANYIEVITNVKNDFTTNPTAYLFAFSVI